MPLRRHVRRQNAHAINDIAIHAGPTVAFCKTFWSKIYMVMVMVRVYICLYMCVYIYKKVSQNVVKV